MEGDWLTYEQAAERLNTTPEAVRQKAIRGRWQRTIGNDKRARIRLPDGWTYGVRTPDERPHKRGVRTAFVRASNAAHIKALEAHVETLKEQLATAEARAEKQGAEAGEQSARLAAELAAERARTEKAIAAFAAPWPSGSTRWRPSARALGGGGWWAENWAAGKV